MAAKSNINLVLVSLAAFGLGFCASEFKWLGFAPADTSKLKQQVPIVQNKPAPVAEPVAPETGSPEPKPLLSTADANQLIASGRYSEAITELKGFLTDNKNTAEAWYLLAQAYRKQNQPRAAVEAWFRFVGLERDAQKLERSLRELKAYLIGLKETPALFNDDFSWLMAQMDELAKYITSSGDLHLVMAALALQLNDSYQAQYHALMAANDPASQKSAEEILAKLNGKNAIDELSIPLVRFGNQYLVNVSVEGFPAQLLLDTGASLSGLSSSYIAKYPFLVKSPKPIRLNTASGSHDSILFTVSNISIANLNFSQHILAQLPMDNLVGFDGLLGVDILGRFDFVIDQDAAQLRLKARKR